MLKFVLRVFLLYTFFSFGNNYVANAQEAVSLSNDVKQHIFSYKEIEVYEDKTGLLKIEDVSAEQFSSKFKSSRTFIPKTTSNKSTYWYRIKIKNSDIKGNYILEFYDQTIDDIKVYYKKESGEFRLHAFGAQLPFEKRELHHKNFTYNINRNFEDEREYYISVKTEQPAAIMIVLKKVSWFIQYGLREYLLLGLLYGMIIVFCLYNLVMFFAMRQKQYIYYILYNLSIGIFEVSSNGIAFQYLWPSFPQWNEIAYGVALFSAATFSMLFTRKFLHLKQKAPILDKVILSYLVIRAIFFLLCLFVNNHWFVYKAIEIVPVILALIAGIRVLRKGYFPARFFVAGYSFIFLGFLLRIIKVLIDGKMPFGPANFYSLSFCLIMEMLFVSFAIGDNVRLLKKKKEKAQKRIIEELHSKQLLKDNLNKQLEQKVLERTKEVVEQSEIIEAQNKELINQAEEINRMNALLAKDNETLQINIKEVTQARVMSKVLSLEEFFNIYPDNDACFSFLAKLKEEKGFECKKCNNHTFYVGHTPYSRRCSQCDYEESVTNGTIFQNGRIPINKAFYMVYLIYTTKGKISSYKLSQILEIRQATCWANSNKIKTLMDERKKEFKDAGEKGWSKLVLVHD